MKKMYLAILATALAFSGSAFAKEKELNIASDSSGLAAEATNNIGRTAVAMGVQEPLVITKTADGVKVAGASATACNIKVAGEKIQGVSCK